MRQQLQAVIVLLTVLGNLLILPKTIASLNSNLTVRVDGLKNQKGQVCLSIYSSNQGFPNQGDRALQSQCVKIAQTPQLVTFENLKAGSYAVAVIHDANADGKLNLNFLGIPTEGFGFSNNPKIRTSPPKFGDSAVLVAGSSTNIQIQLQYLLGG